MWTCLMFILKFKNASYLCEMLLFRDLLHNYAKLYVILNLG